MIFSHLPHPSTLWALSHIHTHTLRCVFVVNIGNNLFFLFTKFMANWNSHIIIKSLTKCERKHKRCKSNHNYGFIYIPYKIQCFCLPTPANTIYTYWRRCVCVYVIRIRCIIFTGCSHQYVLYFFIITSSSLSRNLLDAFTHSFMLELISCCEWNKRAIVNAHAPIVLPQTMFVYRYDARLHTKVF